MNKSNQLQITKKPLSKELLSAKTQLDQLVQSYPKPPPGTKYCGKWCIEFIDDRNELLSETEAAAALIAWQNNPIIQTKTGLRATHQIKSLKPVFQRMSEEELRETLFSNKQKND